MGKHLVLSLMWVLCCYHLTQQDVEMLNPSRLINCLASFYRRDFIKGRAVNICGISESSILLTSEYLSWRVTTPNPFLFQTQGYFTEIYSPFKQIPQGCRIQYCAVCCDHSELNSSFQLSRDTHPLTIWAAQEPRWGTEQTRCCVPRVSFAGDRQPKAVGEQQRASASLLIRLTAPAYFKYRTRTELHSVFKVNTGCLKLPISLPLL